MKTVLGKPLLEYLIERLRRVPSAGTVCIAATTNAEDQPIVDLCRKLDVALVRSSEEDVLDRYYQAARTVKADHVARVTSDCPLIDPEELNKLFRFYLDNAANYEYASSALKRTYPRGMEAEIFSMAGLERAHAEAKSRPEREHVTPYFYTQPEKFRLGSYSYPEDLSAHRWTVDTPEDFDLVSPIIEALYPQNPRFGIKDILALLQKNPAWRDINTHVRQKVYTE